jgi:NAD(P)-dependent dehydrogenase (short-subunit alcohol dehydrogenase family)
VLVTGASGDIGRAIAVAFARGGDRVAVHYSARRAEAEQTLAALPGDGHALVSADLADPGQVADLAAEADGALSGVDVLVNNAAVVTSGYAVADVDYDAWQRAWRETIDVNLHGAANLSYCVARRLIERGAGGAIVNVGSRGAYRGEPDAPAYGASKAGLHALGQSLAVALAPHGISVTSVAPGFVETDRVAGRLAGESGAAIRAQSPYGRVATPEEVAAAVRYLASPDARWSTGAVLDVNGASYLR